MKLFNNLQSLWSYCLYCPICKDMSRDIDVVVGPDDTFTINNFTKQDNILTMNIIIRQSCYRHHYTFIIDAVTNDVNISKRSESSPSIKDFYFYLHSACHNCHSYTNGADIEIDFHNKKLKEVCLEQEAVCLEKFKDKYFLSFDYDNNQMYISRLINDDSGALIQDHKEFKLPILNLDFSSEKKVVNKIKTLLIFS